MVTGAESAIRTVNPLKSAEFISARLETWVLAPGIYVTDADSGITITTFVLESKNEENILS